MTTPSLPGPLASLPIHRPERARPTTRTAAEGAAMPTAPAPTADPRLTCPTNCHACRTHPQHQAEAYKLGLDYGRQCAPPNLTAEIAYWEQQIQAAHRLGVAFLLGIRDALAEQQPAQVG